MRTKVKWLGNATFQIVHREIVIFIDPWFDENPDCPFKTNQVDYADLIFVTHGHPGHWGRGDSVKLANNTGALYVAPTELCNYLVMKNMLPENQVFRIDPKRSYNVKEIPFEVFSAPHPPVPSYPDWLAEVPGEPNCGFLWDFNSTIILHFGDAKYDKVFHEISSKYHVALASLPLWGEGMGISMEEGVETCVHIIADLKPIRVFPTNRYMPNNPSLELLRMNLKERDIEVEIIDQEIGLTVEV